VKSSISFLPLFLFGVALAPAQTIPRETFKHIIIVVQENRTPDNLFGGTQHKKKKCGRENPFEPGVDIVDGGVAKGLGMQCLISLPMNDGKLDPDHTYLSGWFPQYDNGAMDGFCQKKSKNRCVQYSYVRRSDAQPYFAVAKNYGFANYFFQTNEGPSFPAHQFLFAGTSAPVAPLDANNYFLDFVAENTKFHSSGCSLGQQIAKPAWVQPTGTEFPIDYYECYAHDSLVTDAIGDKGVSWRYYTPTPGDIWNAPAAIPEVCYGENSLNKAGHPCSGTEWDHVSMPRTTPKGGAPILDDIANCNLQKISWVIPDEAWSDHPAFNRKVSPPYGPSWVGNIINAIGDSWTQSEGGGVCDYWGNNSPAPEPTAIFVVWDDWGGWFDHVKPPEALRQSPGHGFTNCDPNIQWGCGYAYGFRVPFLVVSEYTPAGYVSGSCDRSGCNSNNFPYQHDFGSILAFTEYNFDMDFIYPGTNYYADFNALDWGPSRSNIPLSDFFSLSNQRVFTKIPNLPYPPSVFRGFYTSTGNLPTGPDGASGDGD
jgi:phospholipase C